MSESRLVGEGGTAPAAAARAPGAAAERRQGDRERPRQRSLLVTGSSGDLGSALVRRLRSEGHTVVGLDPVPSPTTDVVGSVADGPLVDDTFAAHAFDGVLHAGALHKPQVATHDRSDFVATNVQGTLHLLEASVASGSRVEGFVLTSTTSLMISRAIRAGRSGGATRAAWLTEEAAPLRPRNIYGVTKLAAEHLARLQHELHGLPVVVLRTSRFFPEEDDMAHRIVQSGPNTKTNELLFRRAALADVVASHLLALDAAPSLGCDTFLVTAPTPFEEGDCEELIRDAPAVVARHVPRYEATYARLGWTMFESIDRVYVGRRAERVLGFRPAFTFERALDVLDEQLRTRDGAAAACPPWW